MKDFFHCVRRGLDTILLRSVKYNHPNIAPNTRRPKFTLTTEQSNNLAAWIDALRSGDYLQTQHYMSTINSLDDHRYCCLGVACDISSLGGWIKETQDPEDKLSKGWERLSYSIPNTYPKYSSFSPAVARYFGIHSDMEGYLIHLNDNKKYSFSKIADVLYEYMHATPTSHEQRTTTNMG